MKIISWNVNGIRAGGRKGLLGKLESLNADVICFQETKATEEQVAEVLFGSGYHVEAYAAEKKGYSGTAIISKVAPLSVVRGMAVDEHDNEGRLITADFGDCYVVTAYVPNSKGGLTRLPQRQRWDRDLTAYLQRLDAVKPVVFNGDLNVAHQPIDLANPKSNYNKTPGYSQAEIDGLSHMLQAGFVDSWRHQHPEDVCYSWWSMRSGARERNIGWRLDYQLVSHRLMDQVASTAILPDMHGSDHCPVELVLKA
jgi:exodeoxyribonuclease-3